MGFLEQIRVEAPVVVHPERESAFGQGPRLAVEDRGSNAVDLVGVGHVEPLVVGEVTHGACAYGEVPQRVTGREERLV